MRIIQQNKDIILTSCRHFDIKRSFECGQCFRYEESEDGLFTLIAFGNIVRLRQTGDTIIFYDMDKDEFEKIWLGYFDLDRDYESVITELSFDEQFCLASEQACGIRIFRQDGWETLCSFIISQNNNIPRIKKIISALCGLLGEPISTGVNAFPTAESILSAGVEGLAPIKSGFRAKYLIDAAEKVVNGTVNLNELGRMDYKEAKETLMRIKGVGEKVSDCALLFGFGFHQAFPKDVWVKRVLDKYYGSDFDPNYFGENAGIAQQYLFYYERNILSKTKTNT